VNPQHQNSRATLGRCPLWSALRTQVRHRARSEKYLVRPYYIVPEGKVGHDAFAVIRETIRAMDKVAIARVVLTNREHIIALEARGKGLVGMLLRYPYEISNENEYFDDIQDVKVTKDMLDLAKPHRRVQVRRFRVG
jgi:DNA end-binding protein Ku